MTGSRIVRSPSSAGGGSIGQSPLRSYAKPARNANVPLADEPPDKDTLHRLSLAGLPLVTEGLRNARLVKNARFEGVVELFSDEKSGSGQVLPERLNEVFEFRSHNARDLDLIRDLSLLSSYDVYNVRVALRRLDIEVEDVATLQLSDELCARLTPQMKGFTRPLLRAIYGDTAKEAADVKEMINLFVDPDIESARRKLVELSQKLRIDVSAIPKFFEDYGDVYLSLAYYQYCLDQNRPQILSFLKAIEEMQQLSSLKQNTNLMASCRFLQTKVTRIVDDVDSTLDMFNVRTADMWENMSESTFRRMENIVFGYQMAIGAALCIMTVKMSAWHDKFPRNDVGGPWSRAEFLMTNMRPGLEMIEDINYSDLE